MITISNFELLPAAEDCAPGYPTYRVNGLTGVLREPFQIDVVVEIDGRDVEFENEVGPTGFEDDFEIRSEIFQTLCENEAWLALHKKQCDAFYAG